MNTKRTTNLLHTITAATMALLMACGHQSGEQGLPPVKVNVIEVAASQGVGGREYSGVVEEAFSASLSFSAGGQVTKVLVREGQHVREGQLLAQVDNTRAQAAFRAAQATLQQAQDGYDRARQVHDQGSLPEVKWVEVQTQLDQARATFELADKALKDCDLRAPCAGTVSNRRIDPGTSVSPLSPVMDLVGLDGLRIRASVPEEDVAQIRVGQPVEICRDGACPVSPATVEEINPVPDPLTHTYSIRIRLKQTPKDLRPGMTCRVRIPSCTDGACPVSAATGGDGASPVCTAGVEVPSRAVQLDNEGRRYVWVVAPDSTAQTRPITIGDLTRTGVIVSSGLQPGDRVIVDGMLKISTGTPLTF